MPRRPCGYLDRRTSLPPVASASGKRLGIGMRLPRRITESRRGASLRSGCPSRRRHHNPGGAVTACVGSVVVARGDVGAAERAHGLTTRGGVLIENRGEVADPLARGVLGVDQAGRAATSGAALVPPFGWAPLSTTRR